ncbi:hypothetical protein D3C86_2090740 [compost metagenome]
MCSSLLRILSLIELTLLAALDIDFGLNSEPSKSNPSINKKPSEKSSFFSSSNSCGGILCK